MTTMEGKSAFPETHPLALGAAGGGVMTGPAQRFLHEADLILAVGCSLTAHFMHVTLPAGKTLIHATNDERDLNKHHHTEHPILATPNSCWVSLWRPSATWASRRRTGAR